MAFTVEPLLPEHWPAVAAIYDAGIASGNATFESGVPTWETWDASHRPDLRLVAVSEGEVVGWAAASAVSDRCCYAGVVEGSVYVDPRRQRGGIGRSLLQALISATEAAGIWTIQAGIFPENGASIALHERCGFRVVGRRERLGQLHGVWRDVVLLERRSQTAGITPGRPPIQPSDREATVDAESRFDTHLDIRFAPLELIDVQALVDANTHPWYNQTLCKINDCVMRLGVVQGEYIWHKHDDEDEFFYVVEGRLLMDLEDRTVELTERQGFSVPSGVRHRPRAPQRTVILMVEGAGVVPTGD